MLNIDQLFLLFSKKWERNTQNWCECSMGSHSIRHSAEQLRRLEQSIHRQICLWRSTVVVFHRLHANSHILSQSSLGSGRLAAPGTSRFGDLQSPSIAYSYSFFKWIFYQTPVPNPFIIRFPIRPQINHPHPSGPAGPRTADPFGVCQGSPSEREVPFTGSPSGTTDA